MAARAGIVITGTEVLTGRIADRNGPWLADRLFELGVDLAEIVIVGDRPEDLASALRWLGGLDLVITSGGLGPTEDDLTAAVVAEVAGRPLELDMALSERIAAIVAPLLARWPDLSADAIARANRKQAMVPRGAAVLEPVGTAPGLVVPPPDGQSGPTVVVLPGPPRELQDMWEAAVATEPFAAATAARRSFEQRVLRLYGLPESEIAETLRLARTRGVDVDALEVTTCLRRGELEVVTRFSPDQSPLYGALEGVIRERHAATLFSDDGATIDELVARMLLERSWTIATAESCTGGLLGGRLTERAGSSAYALGGLIVYSNAAKVALAGVDPEMIEIHGAVSEEVARELADGACSRLSADVGVGITGVAGPGGGSEDKPVGTVCFSVAGNGGGRDAPRVTRRLRLPGARSDVRERSLTVALHLVRDVLQGHVDPR